MKPRIAVLLTNGELVKGKDFVGTRSKVVQIVVFSRPEDDPVEGLQATRITTCSGKKMGAWTHAYRIGDGPGTTIKGLIYKHEQLTKFEADESDLYEVAIHVDGMLYELEHPEHLKAAVVSRPQIEVLKDYDGYFQRLVESWVERKVASGKPFKSEVIKIVSGPYRPAAVEFNRRNNEGLLDKRGKVLTLDFYSALRTGFGSLSESEVKDIIELL